MRHRAKIVSGLMVITAIAGAAYAWFSPLTVFTRRISEADRAVVTMAAEPTVSITITGEALRSVVGMVSSAHRDPENYMCAILANVSFFKDSQMLGQMRICVQLMLIGGRQYRDDTRLLKTLIVNPLLEAKAGAETQSQTDVRPSQNRANLP